MSEKLGERLSERLRKRLGERFGEMLCKSFGEMLDPNMLQLYFRQASSRIQEGLNLLQLPSPDEGLIIKGQKKTTQDLKRHSS